MSTLCSLPTRPMSDPDRYDAPGIPVEVDDFQNRKAKELTVLLQADEASPHSHFVEARRSDSNDIVVLDVEPEVPQNPVHDIRLVERIAVVFDHEDRNTPEPLALRRGFPKETLHQNIIVEGTPRSLCLHEEPYQERRLRWTAGRFVRRLREWLSQAARDELHDEDQSLERLFLGTPHRIVLPPTLYSGDSSEVPNLLTVVRLEEIDDGLTIVTQEGAPGGEEVDQQFVGVTYNASPQTHGIIQAQPTSVAKLDQFLGGEDFLGVLRERLKDLEGKEEDRPLDSQLIITVRIPKLREESTSPESTDVWAFATKKEISAVGEDIGIWEMKDGEPGGLITTDDSVRGENTKLFLLNPTQSLTKGRAAELSGAKVSRSHHVAVGLGTLGSQVQTNLAKIGYGRWTLIDKDVLLPHNVPRHHLGGTFVGTAKSASIAGLENLSFESPIAEPFVGDVLSARGGETDIDEALRSADHILDMSASVAVSRHLALDIDSDARRTSLFMIPNGRDLVLLAEPSDRSLRLDQLEMEYYRGLVENEELSGHLQMNGERLRYGQSCRDVSSELPQDLAALHSGIGARVYRSLESDSSVRLWRTHQDMSVNSISINARDHLEFDVGGWTISVSAPVIEEMKTQRQERLPNETGGVLFGVFDTERSRIYVIGTIPAPPDSEEWPDAYIRGAEGLQNRLEEISVRTGGQVEYVGEWHSHPPDTDTGASDDDESLFKWLSRHRQKDGVPAVMAIQGTGDKTRWFVDTLSKNHETQTPEI